MYNIDSLNGKRILIWGYGREGKSTDSFLKKYCPDSSVSIYEGNAEGIDEIQYDIVFKSPGIIFNEEKDMYTSQTEVFLNQYRDKVIGITGTKGKSTTSAMLYYVLKKCFQNTEKKVILLGNMGKPCLDYYGDITDDTIVIFEMSCHQLAHLKVSPHIAVLLNFYEDHLDYYGTYEKYIDAKKNIARYQNDTDYTLIGENVDNVMTKAKIVKINYDVCEEIELSVLGEHNRYNAKFVEYIAINKYNCDESQVRQAMREFTGLPHRLQYVGRYNQIDFYDDSISTIPEATVYAIKSVPNAETVIIGGMDRKINYDDLIQFINNNKTIKFICCYESGRRIYESVNTYDNIYYVKDIKEAVDKAKKITTPGKSCILSPAAASYGYFKDFEERGDFYKSCILN